MGSIRDVILSNSRSVSARAAMDSTTTTALGTMMGSWRPWMEISISSPDWFTVCWGAAMDGVGLKAAPEDQVGAVADTARTPPEWLVRLAGVPSGVM